MVKDVTGTPQVPNYPEVRAKQSYAIALKFSGWLSVSQFVVSLFGGWLHLLADGVALAFYTDMWNEIRAVYGKGMISADAAKVYLWPNLSFIIGDLLLDKGLGMIPLAGSIFCYWFARALTFRLAALFGVLAALDEETPEAVVLEKVSNLIQELYPRKSFLFTLTDPDMDTFITLLASMEGLKGAEAETRLETALAFLRGEFTIDEVEEEVSDADFEVEVIENFQQYGMVLWDGAVLSVEDEEPVITVDEEQQMPLEDEVFDTPVAVIPESLTRYLFPEEMQPKLIRETDDDASDGGSGLDGEDQAHDTSKYMTKPPDPPARRLHRKTGKKPSGRPKKG